MSLRHPDREATDRFVVGYNNLLEEVKQLRQRRKAALEIIKDQRLTIAILREDLAEANEREKNRKSYHR